jgi:hypothetical protein
MTRPTEAQVSAMETRLIEQGKIIEAGWLGLRAMTLPPDAPPIQIDEMRSCFFAGAQHLFACIMRTLDPGEEPTDADMARLDKIHDELQAFIVDYAARRLPTEGRA